MPITIRIIRFDKTGEFCLPFHYDTSIMSLIFPSNDDPLKECLILAPADGSSFATNQYRRPIRPILDNFKMSCPLLITGTLLLHLRIPILPTPHAALPHDRDSRYVITACCHVPYLNTSEMSSLLSHVNEIPEQFKEKEYR